MTNFLELLNNEEMDLKAVSLHRKDSTSGTSSLTKKKTNGESPLGSSSSWIDTNASNLHSKKIKKPVKKKYKWTSEETTEFIKIWRKNYAWFTFNRPRFFQLMNESIPNRSILRVTTKCEKLSTEYLNSLENLEKAGKHAPFDFDSTEDFSDIICMELGHFRLLNEFIIAHELVFDSQPPAGKDKENNNASSSKKRKTSTPVQLSSREDSPAPGPCRATEIARSSSDLNLADEMDDAAILDHPGNNMTEHHHQEEEENDDDDDTREKRTKSPTKSGLSSKPPSEMEEILGVLVEQMHAFEQKIARLVSHQAQQEQKIQNLTNVLDVLVRQKQTP